jgi:predicted DNA-binding transcriptional regulator AlpA
MAKRKSDPTLAGQLDMFGEWLGQTPSLSVTKMASLILPPSSSIEGANIGSASANKTAATLSPANDASEKPIIANQLNQYEIVETSLSTPCVTAIFESQSLGPPDRQSMPNQTWLDDEWWTTSMVCSFLKLGRKAIWERQRDPTLAFPQAFHFGSMRHRWRSEDIRNWARDQFK